jgi:hypothetical protein
MVCLRNICINTLHKGDDDNGNDDDDDDDDDDDNNESSKLRNCEKQPYWTLHTYCGKC